MKILKDFALGFIIMLIGLHTYNWKVKGLGWKGNDIIGQVVTLPWSLI